MNNPLDPTLRELNDCGCCAGTTDETPASTDNRPGLDAVGFRAGTQPEFKATMIAALSALSRPALRDLKTRDDDDFTIALLDGWAVVADVLSFYSERIANEAFLRTATERRSVLELARSIGYELNPGVAASTWLAFTVEDAAGTPGWSNIPSGTKVQSIPGPGEKPQFFETLAPLLARKEWNALHPCHTRRPRAMRWGQDTLRVAGTATNLKPGDALLIIGDERKNPSNENWDFRRIKTLATFPNDESPYTLITLDHGLGTAVPFTQPAQTNPRVFALRQRLNLFGYNAPDPRTLQFTLSGLLGEYFKGINFQQRMFTRVDATVDFDWTGIDLGHGLGSTQYSVRWTGVVKSGAAGIYEFTTTSDDGVRLWVNGRLLVDKWVNQPPTSASGQITLAANTFYDLRLDYYQDPGGAQIHLLWKEPGQASQITPAERLFRSELPAEWPGLTLADISGTASGAEVTTLHLEGTHPEVIPGGWLVVSTPEYREVYGVTSVAEDSRSGFTLNAKTTRVGVNGENLREKFNDRVRAVTVFAQSEELQWAAEPVYDALFGETIQLDQPMPGLPAERDLFVSGLPARVRVTAQGATLQLMLADGTQRALNVGDQLTLTVAPSPQADTAGISRWALQADDGAEGFLFATSSQLAFAPAADDSERLFESVQLKRAPDPAAPGLLPLIEPLKYAYDPTTVIIYGNAVFATHGETVGSPTQEVLGSGDTNQSHQRFVLKQAPLTFVPAANPSGGETTLEVWVNDVKWTEVPTLFGRGPNERVYVTRRGDDGDVTVLFGDGEHGARLPTGRENVRAVYRKGIGRDGLLKADQLKLLITRPLGVKAVTNPEAPAGGVDPQVLSDARRNAPTTVLTLDRVVSLQDYEDVTANFTGIAKALATWTWNAHSRGVFLTVAGIGGTGIALDSPVRDKLLDSLRTLGNPLVPVDVQSYRAVKFKLAGTVFVQPDHLPEKVIAAVKDALKTGFLFDARSFGQPVTLSEVVAVIQNIPGVDYVDLDALYLGATSKLEHYLPAQKPADGAAAQKVLPAELLTLDETCLAALEVKTT